MPIQITPRRFQIQDRTNLEHVRPITFETSQGITSQTPSLKHSTSLVEM